MVRLFESSAGWADDRTGRSNPARKIVPNILKTILRIKY
jgi:hypothetical protein